MILTELYQESALLAQIIDRLGKERARLHVDGLVGSLPAVLVASLARRCPTVSQLAIAPSKEEAFYLQNDIEALMGMSGERRTENGEQTDAAMGSPLSTLHSPLQVMLFPTSYRKAYHYDTDLTDNANLLMRTEVMKTLGGSEPAIVVSYPEALAEKVVAPRTLGIDFLISYNFVFLIDLKN